MRENAAGVPALNSQLSTSLGPYRNLSTLVVLDSGGNDLPMNIAYKYTVTTLMSLALANFQSRCRGAEPAPVNLAERIRVLETEDPGLLPIDQAARFPSSILKQAASGGVAVLSISKVTSRTNVPFTELRQNVALEATEAQLLDFLGNVAASNSTLRVQSLSLHPTPDRSRLRANLAITGDYRLPAAGQSQETAPAQSEYLVLSQRRHLRQAALDCYNLTKSTLPAGWTLDSLSFQDGTQLSIQGTAPAAQVSSLPDVRERLEKAQVQDGQALFQPSSGEATMRRAPGSTNFSWSMQFALAPLESL
jgi:hypothetical protein